MQPAPKAEQLEAIAGPAIWSWLVEMLDKFCAEHGGTWRRLTEMEVWHAGLFADDDDKHFVVFEWTRPDGETPKWAFSTQEESFGPEIALERMESLRHAKA